MFSVSTLSAYVPPEIKFVVDPHCVKNCDPWEQVELSKESPCGCCKR